MKGTCISLALIGAMLISTVSLAQQAKWGTYGNYPDNDIIPYRKGKLWGYADSTGKIVMEPKYDRTWFFAGKLAFFAKHDTSEVTGVTMKTGIITRSGKVLVEPTEYMSSHIISDSTAMVLVSEPYIIDHKGNKYPLKHHRYDMYYNEGLTVIQQEEGWYILNAIGNVIAGPLTQYNNMYNYTGGAATAHRKDGTTVLLDRSGKELPSSFKRPLNYISGFSGSHTLNKTEYTDRKGNTYEYYGTPVMIRSAYSRYTGSPVKNNVAILHKNGKPGLLDTLGNILVPFGKYDTINEFSSGLARCVVNDGESSIKNVRFINAKGVEVIPPLPYPEVYGFREGLARVHTGKEFGYIDTTGKLAFKVKGLEGAFDFYEGLAHVIKGDRHGFINKKGKYVIEPTLYYDEVGDFSDGMALVHVNNGYGYIDRTGKEVIPAKKYYASITPFYNGAAETREEYYGPIVLIGKDGKPLPYTYHPDSEWIRGRYRTIISIDGFTYGIVNEKQELVVPLKYKYIISYPNGTAKLIDNEGVASYYHLGTGKILAED